MDMCVPLPDILKPLWSLKHAQLAKPFPFLFEGKDERERPMTSSIRSAVWVCDRVVCANLHPAKNSDMSRVSIYDPHGISLPSVKFDTYPYIGSLFPRSLTGNGYPVFAHCDKLTLFCNPEGLTGLVVGQISVWYRDEPNAFMSRHNGPCRVIIHGACVSPTELKYTSDNITYIRNSRNSPIPDHLLSKMVHMDPFANPFFSDPQDLLEFQLL